jgi:hypothetical protein
MRHFRVAASCDARQGYPALLSLAGATAALIPGIPVVTLEPELALVLFVAPIHLARQATAQAAIQALEGHGESEPVAMLRQEYRARAAGGAEAPIDAGSLAGLQGRAVAVQRRVLQELRRDGTIGDDAYHAIEEELDIIELTADPRVRTLDGPASRH